MRLARRLASSSLGRLVIVLDLKERRDIESSSDNIFISSRTRLNLGENVELGKMWSWGKCGRFYLVIQNNGDRGWVRVITFHEAA